MKILLNNKNKIKISLGILFLVLSIILTSLIEKNNLEKIDQGFSSIFADRLIPATDIFLIANHLYERRLELQSLLFSSENNGLTFNKSEMEKQNCFIDSLLYKFQGTYLVESEKVCLKGLIKNWNAYKAHEAKILYLALNNEKAKAKALFNTADNSLFRSIIHDLQLLEKIQSEVGEDLMHSSRSSISLTNSIFALQSGILIVIALIGNIVLVASRFMKQSRYKIHLN